MAERVCAVIVAAYKATRWIRESLDSIAAQEPLEGWSYETRVGVDGCEETSKHLLQARVPHWFSPVNLGPYLVRNALMFGPPAYTMVSGDQGLEKDPADAYAIFDADDVMGAAYLRTLIPLAYPDGIAGSARFHLNVKKPKKPRLPQTGYSVGVAVYSAGAMQKLGGFRPWRITADWDAILRARILKVPVVSHPEPLYTRRLHDESLTGKADTGSHSKERRAQKSEGRKLSQPGKKLWVKPECAEMVWREPETERLTA